MLKEDIKAAKAEAEKFIAFVNDYLKLKNSTDAWCDYPVEKGLIKAQSLILSKSLSLMRNPYGKRGLQRWAK